MLPWRRASICNRDNSWGMKAFRRGRVTSGIQITDNGNQSKSSFPSCYQTESVQTKQIYFCFIVLYSSHEHDNSGHLDSLGLVKTHAYTFNYTEIKKKKIKSVSMQNGQCEFKQRLTQIQGWATTGTHTLYLNDCLSTAKHTQTQTRTRTRTRTRTHTHEESKCLIDPRQETAGG